MKNELNIREIQLIAVNTLDKIDSICKQLGIQYWGMYGTMLGAIRHHGFIPWDDDLDIAMSRADYDKFIDYCMKNQKELSHFSIDNHNTVKNYPYYISRFCDNDYSVVYDNTNYKSGLFIDIYPFDGMGNSHDVSEHNKRSFRIRMIQKLIHSKTEDFFNSKNKKSNPFVSFLFVLGSRLLKKDYLFSLLDKESSLYSWEESEFIGTPAWEFRPIQFKKDLFHDFISVPFESRTIPVPTTYNEILTTYYGNYMKLPPVEERVPHHNYHAYKKTNDTI